ncbi:TldD/PmbA family protein [Candidatus Micrarchaeota archaeon]|nr:TldD/PmbA family protein [Candidatus Micrarchaeota archaeon]
MNRVFALHEDLADYCVEFALSHGASYAEARLEERSSTGFLLKNGVLESAAFDSYAGIGARFVLQGALGFVAVNQLTKPSLEKTLSTALKVTKASAKIAEKTVFAPSFAKKAKHEVHCRRSPEGVSAEEKTSLLRELDSAVLASKAKIVSRYVSLSDDVVRKYYSNSEGSRIESLTPYVNVFYAFTVEAGGKTAQRNWQYGASKGYECFGEWQLQEKLRDEARAIAKNLSEAKPVPSGKFDVIAGPEVVGIMAHESVGHPYEADRILGREAAQAGESFVKKEMLGTKIGSDAANVVDDPTVEEGFGHYLYDDEGVAAKRKKLMTKGVITEFLHNRETAAALGCESNGGARASEYDKEPIVRMSNTFVLPGDFSEEELLAEVKNGVFIKNFQEWNIDDKRLNQKYVGSEAYLIKNGEVTEPVFQPVIEITTPALWSAVAACSKKVELHAASCGKGEPMQGINVSMGGPHCLFKGIRF